MSDILKKRILSLLLAGILTLSLAACGNTDSTSGTEDVSKTSEQGGEIQPNTSATGESGSTELDGNNILIAYFTAAENSGVDAIASASYTTIDGQAVGRVRAVADMIQENVGGDLFSIRTSVVYPTDGGELIDYAARSRTKMPVRNSTSHIENLDQYDTIFIGYPNWWADLPMAVYSFFDEYDFSGRPSSRLMSITEAGSPAPSRPLRSWSRMLRSSRMVLRSASRRWPRLPRMWLIGWLGWDIKENEQYAEKENRSVSFASVMLHLASHCPCWMCGFQPGCTVPSNRIL